MSSKYSSLQRHGSHGQAMLEYLIVLALLAFIGAKSVQTIGTVMAKSLGNMASVVSIHLTVGVCGAGGQFNCFFANYKNGIEN